MFHNMLLTPEQLEGLLVETESGIALGHITACAIETDGQLVAQYYVKSGGIAHVFAKELLISRDAVIHITAEKMIVQDTAYKQENNTNTEQARVKNSNSLQAEPIAQKIHTTQA